MSQIHKNCCNLKSSCYNTHMNNSLLMMLIGAVVIAIGCYAILRVRRHSVKEGLAMAAGVLGMVAVLALIKWFIM